MYATVVYRFADDAYLVGWDNRRVAMVRLEIDAERIAAALEEFHAAGWAIKIHGDCDGADISNGKVRYLLAPLALAEYAPKLLTAMPA